MMDGCVVFSDVVSQVVWAWLPIVAKWVDGGRTEGVTFWFEMYLCLCNTVAKTLVARVFNIPKVHTQ